MNSRTLALTGLAFALLVTPALAQDPAPVDPATATDEAADAGAKADMDKVICKKAKVTNTRIKQTRICKTKREWEQMRRDAKDMVDGLDRDRHRDMNPLPSAGG